LLYLLLIFTSSIITLREREVAVIDSVRLLSSIKDDGFKVESQDLFGEYKELCDLIGYEAVEKIYLKYSGGYVSLPQKFLSDEFIRHYIVTCCGNGRTISEMARKCGYSYSWVLRLTKKG